MIELETLAKVPLFTGVDTEALIFLQPCFKQLLVPKGTVIIKENTWNQNGKYHCSCG